MTVAKKMKSVESNGFNPKDYPKPHPHREDFQIDLEPVSNGDNGTSYKEVLVKQRIRGTGVLHNGVLRPYKQLTYGCEQHNGKLHPKYDVRNTGYGT